MECGNISLNRCSKPRRSCGSMSILVVDDDTTCLALVAALLKKLKYEVVTAKHPNDALCALRIKGGAFDLVVSDVHMPDMDGFQLQQAITHEFNLPVILMSVDSNVSKGIETGAALFISKPVSANDLKDLWQFAKQNLKSASTVSNTNNNDKEKSKRKSEGSESDDLNTKKPKVVWTNALHCRFLEAIRSIGLERCVPKKILQVMNVPGLTRENVASHLQKYRIFLKRVSDASYKLEVGADNEALLGRSYVVSNYSLQSLNRLNKPQFDFGNFLASYEKAPSFHTHSSSDAPILASINKNSEIISALLPSMQQISGECVNVDSNELQINIDQSLQINGGIVDDSSPFCSVYGLPAFDNIATQPSKLNQTHLHNTIPSHKLSIQNQEQQHAYEYTESSHLYDAMPTSSYDQAVYQQQVQGSIDSVEFGGVSSQFDKAFESPNEDDNALESLLAFGLFGEDQIQTLEGI